MTCQKSGVFLPFFSHSKLTKSGLSDGKVRSFCLSTWSTWKIVRTPVASVYIGHHTSNILVGIVKLKGPLYNRNPYEFNQFDKMLMDQLAIFPVSNWQIVYIGISIQAEEPL